MRVPLIWLWRMLVGGFALAYLGSGTLQAWVPPLLPFVCAAVVEVQFFLSGLGTVERRTARDPGPQAHDLAELGWAALPDGVDEPQAPAPSLRRRSRLRRRFAQGVVVLALLAGVVFLDRSRPTWQKLPAPERAATLALLDRQAASVAGRPAEVVCDVGGRRVGYVQDADGLAEVGGRRLWLTPEICYRLARIRHMSAATEESSGHAIAVLAHEAWHLHGERSEGIANCYAYQSGVRIGQALGLSAGTARRLMRRQLADNPSDFAGAPAYVVPSGCHRGGSLDLGLDGTHFP